MEHAQEDIDRVFWHMVSISRRLDPMFSSEDAVKTADMEEEITRLNGRPDNEQDVLWAETMKEDDNGPE